MKRILLSATILSGFFASAVAAQSIGEQVIAQLQEQGYTRIEVKNGLTQVKVEAIRGNKELEIIYDAVTGAILKQEVNNVDAGDDTAPGVEIRTEDKDFIDDDGRDDDDDEDEDDDDDNSGHGNDDDHDDDDNPGRGGDDDDDDGEDDNRGHGNDDDRDDDDNPGRGGDDSDDSDDDEDEDDDSDDSDDDEDEDDDDK